MRDTTLQQIRQLCLAWPETSERLSHGAPAFFVQGKKCFLMYMDNHHQDGRLAIWCAAPFGAQQAFTQARPTTFFVPPYVGHRGWLGVCLDRGLSLEALTEIIRDAYRCVAPRKLISQLDKPVQ
ncbi:MmcQ/YjbR family DNA-binding protein [uncultured Meiothermus sp.]|uniref:MmcQ/YjbR family DNA-binding protein n=1 Tax=uncultured Meiothermus sp. TaxID=157471 RepID=UPI00262D181F|nr:MmcQ/YjbR family DNA-binding protein [uncultured Meiothermus sp.]